MTTGMPGVTAAEAPCRKPPSPNHTMAPNGFKGIARTRREKTTARRKKRADENPVTLDQTARSPDGEAGRLNRCSSSILASASRDSGGACFVRTTQSHPESLSCLKRKTSRISRLIWLRRTLVPVVRRATMIPRRAPPRPFATRWTAK